MTQEQFEREKNFRAALYIADLMLRKQLITDEEHDKINKQLIEKYSPVFGGLCG